MQIQLIGVSLSEPHTSVTALQVQDANLPSTYHLGTYIYIPFRFSIYAHVPRSHHFQNASNTSGLATPQ